MIWYLTEPLAAGLFRTTEPAVNDWYRANTYTLHGRDADLQVDFGCGFAPFRQALPLTGKPVIAVATHVHVDHVGGLHEFSDRRGPAAEAAAFASMAEAATFQHRLRDAARGPAFDRPPSPGFDLAAWRLVPAPLTQALAEGDVIDLGDRRFRVLHLPGHSPGSMGLLDEAAGLLFSGDAIYDDTLLDDIPGASIPDYVVTMERLRRLDIAVAHGGHGPPMTPVRMREIAEDYLRARG
jgi:glyoxylase-like metal-dependent hydrolase (beta-lactamase superfamily II)